MMLNLLLQFLILPVYAQTSMLNYGLAKEAFVNSQSNIEASIPYGQEFLLIKLSSYIEEMPSLQRFDQVTSFISTTSASVNTTTGYLELARLESNINFVLRDFTSLYRISYGLEHSNKMLDFANALDEVILALENELEMAKKQGHDVSLPTSKINTAETLLNAAKTKVNAAKKVMEQGKVNNFRQTEYTQIISAYNELRNSYIMLQEAYTELVVANEALKRLNNINSWSTDNAG